MGWRALVDSIQVSDHPVTPSLGMTSATCRPALRRSLVISGQPAPTTASPDLNSCSKSVASAQYFRTSERCCLSLPLTWLSVAELIA